MAIHFVSSSLDRLVDVQSNGEYLEFAPICELTDFSGSARSKCRTRRVSIISTSGFVHTSLSQRTG